MANVIKILRSATSGSLPTAKTEGEPWWNEADLSFGVVDAAGASQRLIAIRFFSALATYAVGDFVVEAGQLYRNITAVAVPGAFDPTEWEGVGAVDLAPYATITYVDAEIAAVEAQLADYLPLAGGTTTGEIILPGAPTDPLAATDKTYVDDADAALQGQITVLASNLIFSGSIAVLTDTVMPTTESGLTAGDPLPAAAITNRNMYLIVTDQGAAAAGEIPTGDYDPADWIVSDGTTWHHLPIGEGAATQVTAPMVVLSPDLNTWGSVQVAIEQLDLLKLHEDSVLDAGQY